jgi:hypothetical protein
VVAFLVFNQYSGPVEPIYPSWQEASESCKASWSNPDPYPLSYRNTALFMESAGLLYRPELSFPREPPPAFESLPPPPAESPLLPPPVESTSPPSVLAPPPVKSWIPPPVLSPSQLPVISLTVPPTKPPPSPPIVLPPSLAGATDWNSISPLLESSFGHALPTPPSAEHAARLFDGVAVGSGAPFAAFTITAQEGPTVITDSTAAVDRELVACNSMANSSVLLAGPSVLCSAEDSASGTCRGLPAGTLACKAAMNRNSVQLNSRHGTSGWAPASAYPSYIQYTFPALPQGASSVTLRYTIDERYRPELYGGNPCPNGSATYSCSLCVSEPWDFSTPSGIHVLWSAAGRDTYVVSGPHSQLMAAFDTRDFTQILDAPVRQEACIHPPFGCPRETDSMLISLPW